MKNLAICLLISILIYGCKKTEVDLGASTIAIPDANFENYLVKQKIDKDGQVNGKMFESDAKLVDRLVIDSLGIKSLSGIEYFVNLRFLNCSKNLLTEIDISKNTALEVLYCFRNNLKTLDTKMNINLVELSCWNNQLTAIEVSQNTKLKSLICSYNRLTNIDITKNQLLQYLACAENQLETLNLIKNSELEELWCWNNKLTNLDISFNPFILTLDCTGNKIAKICINSRSKITNNWIKDKDTEYTVCQ